MTSALVQLADHGQRPRCGDPTTHALWTSDLRADRKQAAACCPACAVLAPCVNAGNAEVAGVWGGVDRSRRRPEAEGEPP